VPLAPTPRIARGTPDPHGRLSARRATPHSSFEGELIQSDQRHDTGDERRQARTDVSPDPVALRG
jgi:hypothetical protein